MWQAKHRAINSVPLGGRQSGHRRRLSLRTTKCCGNRQPTCSKCLPAALQNLAGSAPGGAGPHAEFAAQEMVVVGIAPVRYTDHNASIVDVVVLKPPAPAAGTETRGATASALQGVVARIVNTCNTSILLNFTVDGASAAGGGVAAPASSASLLAVHEPS